MFGFIGRRLELASTLIVIAAFCAYADEAIIKKAMQVDVSLNKVECLADIKISLLLIDRSTLGSHFTRPCNLGMVFVYKFEGQ